MASPVDVGALPNHVKYCVSVLSLQWANIRTSPVAIPYTSHLCIIVKTFANEKILLFTRNHVNPKVMS